LEESNLAHEALFKEYSEDPDRWHDSALVLKGAAEAVGEIQLAAAREVVVVESNASQEQLERLMYGPPFLLLAGLSIENLAKAMLLRRCGPKSEGGKLPSGIGGHGILRLLDKCGLPLSADERRLARRFEVFILWAGRYPVPTKAPDMEAVKVTYWTDLRDFKTLFAKLQTAYRRGW
jgi:hypothetical protein